jgi:hypothetical protein
MKTNNIKQASLFIAGVMLSLNVFSQAHVTMSMKNITATKNTIEYDLYIVNDGTTPMKLSACSYGVNYNSAILNKGESQYMYKQNSRGTELSGLKNFSLASKNTREITQARMITTPSSFANSPELIQHKPFKVGHFVLSNNVAWASNSNPEFSLQEKQTIGLTTTQVVVYTNKENKLIALTPSLNSVTTEVDQSPILNPGAIIENHTGSSVEFNETNNQHGVASTHMITLYPNPATDQLKLDFNADATDILRIKITDFHGRIVKQIQTNVSTGLNQVTIDVSELASGLYTIQLKDSNKLNDTKSFTKQ